MFVTSHVFEDDRQSLVAEERYLEFDSCLTYEVSIASGNSLSLLAESEFPTKLHTTISKKGNSWL